MNGEINSTINVLPPFKRLCMTIGELPASYLETMTYYESLLWLTKYLSETVIPTINNNAEAVSELQNLYKKLEEYVNNYFTDLNIQTEINNKLDEMAQDGTLENLLSNLFVKNNGTLVASLFYRDCTDFINGITEESQQAPIKGFFQGMTTTPSSIIFAIQPAGSYENKLNYVYLVEISKSTKNVLRESYLELYHANSLAYNDTLKEIYVACNSYINENEQSVNFNRIITVDYTTFTIKDTPTLSNDIIDNLNGEHLMGVSYDNKNDILAVSSKTKLFILDDFETVSEIITLNYNNTAPINNEIFNNETNQQIKLFDNKIYQSRVFGNGLVIYDIDGNVIQNYYDLDVDIPIKLGELETFEIERDGTLYFNTVQRTFQGSIYSFYDRTIFKSNIIKNGYKNFKKISNSLLSGNTLHVNPLTTNNIQVGTTSFPFKSITQALLTCEFNENIPSYIQCDTEANYGIIINRLSKFISINGNNVASFYGIIAQGCNMTISNTIFDLTNDLTLIGENKNIVIENSKYYLNTCTFNGDENNPNNYAIYVSSSDLTLRNSTFNNFVNAFNNNINTNLYLTRLTFTNCTYKYLNSHNLVNIIADSQSIYTDSNPSSYLPFVSRVQLLENTIDENKLIFEENIASKLNIINFSYKIAYSSTNLYFSDTVRKGSFRLTHYCFTDKEFLIDITGSYNDAGHYINLTPKILKREIDGSLTNITSDCTITWYRCYNIY